MNRRKFFVALAAAPFMQLAAAEQKEKFYSWHESIWIDGRTPRSEMLADVSGVMRERELQLRDFIRRNYLVRDCL